MTRNDAIIFDLDGTLWNACASSALGWNEGLAELGEPARVTGKQVETVSGKPFEECVEVLLPGLQARRPGSAAVLARHEREAIERCGGVFYDGALAGIKTLSQSYRLFVVSNCQDWYLDLFLKLSGLGPFFAGGDCHGRSRLFKDAMLAHMKRDFRLERPVYVGDTPADQKAALAAGVEFMHAGYGFGKPESPCLSVPSFSALVEHFTSR